MNKYIVGIDEVGRGPIAGPVAVCAFSCAITNLPASETGYELLITNGVQETKSKLKDSKKLSKKQREKWFEYLKKEKQNGNCDFAVSYVSPQNIDKFGIVKSIQKALDSSLEKLNANGQLLNAQIYLDGGLKAPIEFINQETVIKGDELHPIISMASIMAKVSRDKIMVSYAKDYPEYGFEKHSGYGTKAHYDAIKKHGLIPLHRKSFIN